MDRSLFLAQDLEPVGEQYPQTIISLVIQIFEVISIDCRWQASPTIGVEIARSRSVPEVIKSNRLKSFCFGCIWSVCSATLHFYIRE
jgi:hypothetical protein